jgi:hypothetical protein
MSETVDIDATLKDHFDEDFTADDEEGQDTYRVMTWSCGGNPFDD